MAATLGVAAVVCCTACTAGDICNDLKTGQLVGAAPWRQQTMQVAGVAVAALVMAPVLQLLHDTTPGGIGGKELAAPQAQLFSSLVQGLFGATSLPWNMLGIGAGINIGVVLVDYGLRLYRCSFRAHLMPIAVGMYLPLGLSVPILAGGVMAEVRSRKYRPGAEGPGVLLASGAIAGEALTGILIALLVSVGVLRLQLGLPDALISGVTIAVVLLTFVFFYVASRSIES
jgi:putative OPT family oligopeptide transporter